MKKFITALLILSATACSSAKYEDLQVSCRKHVKADCTHAQLIGAIELAGEANTLVEDCKIINNSMDCQLSADVAEDIAE